MNVLILSGTNHQFAASALVIHEFLSAHDDLSVALDDDKDVLASDGLRDFDVLIHGTGFTRTERREDGTVQQVPELTLVQEEGLFDFVAYGKGLVGIHGTAWWIGGKAADLIGGHANWHPPGSTFTVDIIDSDHPVTQGVPDFDVEDEIYMSAWDPAIRILATAECERQSASPSVGQTLRCRAGVLHGFGAWAGNIYMPRDAADNGARSAVGRRKSIKIHPSHQTTAHSGFPTSAPPASAGRRAPASAPRRSRYCASAT